MTRAILAAIGLLAATVAVARAEQGAASPVVVELFTSQGCSSCPPADAILADLARRGDVIALALHVDYWDYLGWKDVFADPSFTERQKAYARVAGARSVYTPQMVVQGMEHLVGVKPMELGDLIRSHAERGAPVTLSVTREGDRLAIRAAPAAAAVRPADVHVVSYLPSATTQIERGENAGLTMTYVNIVRDWQKVGSWDGMSPLALSVAVAPGPAAVIIQEQGPGAILAAAKVR